MQSRALVCLSVVLLLASSCMGLGTLWVNNIRGNSDTNTVVIEEVVVDDNTVYVDFINGLSESLVTIEDVEFFEGNVRVPVDLLVEQVATIQGLLNTNGGILADDAVEGGFSFKVEDDSGITTIKRGELRPDGGINVDNLKFEVKPSGETTIAEAPLRPNGGINSNNGQFTVSADDGSVLTQGNLEVELDIILGTDRFVDRYIRRVPTDARQGGSTILAGQNSQFSGGDLVLLPGYNLLNGPSTPGNIVLGRQAPDPLLITRAASGTQQGGKTIFSGQSSTGGQGGDIYIQAGSTTDLDSSGGDVVLIPGLPGEGGAIGDIVLGPGSDREDEEYAGYDLTVRRPVLNSDNFLNASATYFEGQSSLAGAGGSLYFRAGSVIGQGNERGGDLVLEPGYSNQEAGSIFLGRPEADEILVARIAVDDNAGSTHIHGQDSNTGNGGHLTLEAGSALSNGNGGDLYLAPGKSANGGTAGQIVWGNVLEDLVVRRPAGGAIATTTTIQGQDAQYVGGDLLLRSGKTSNLNGDSGSIEIRTPNTNGESGSIALFSGDAVQQAGHVILTAGSTGQNNQPGGDVSISAGASNSGTGGNIELNAGLGSTVNGEVIVQQAERLLANEVDVVINNGVLRIQDGTNVVEISPDPTNVLTLNGDRLLTARRGNVISPLELFPGGAVEEGQLLLDLAAGMNALIRELSQCGHGLISVVDNDGRILQDNSAFCNPNRRRSVNELNFDSLLNYDISCAAGSTLTPDDQDCLMADAAAMPDALADQVITGPTL